jgi:hypothetical protein
MSSQRQVATSGSEKPEAPQKRSAEKKLETNFGDWVNLGPEKYEKSKWAIVSSLTRDVTDCMPQHTTYFIRLADIVQLPVSDMKGEGLTSVWAITLQSRLKDKHSVSFGVYDAVVVSMAPQALNVCLSISGYGDRPEPQ